MIHQSLVSLLPQIVPAGTLCWCLLDSGSSVLVLLWDMCDCSGDSGVCLLQVGRVLLLSVSWLVLFVLDCMVSSNLPALERVVDTVDG